MSDRTVIVTGAFGVLGSAVAAAFEANGDKVARIDFAPVPAEPPDNGFGNVDLTDPAAAQTTFDTVVDTIGAPTVLVNVAGGFIWQTLADGELSKWQRIFEMNAMTASTMCKVALPTLLNKPSAAIINIGSMAAANAGAGMGAYAASKAAVSSLTQSLAAEVAGSDLTVNAVLPQVIDTPTNRADMPDADFTTWVRPAKIAEVILFLASPAARAITGAEIPVARGTARFEEN